MYKVSFPRSDVTVKVGSVVIKPALALMGWAAFIKSGSNAATYGDLVVLEDDVNPVIRKLEERGLELSALHNHLLHETPRIMFIHFVGRAETRWYWQQEFGRHWRSLKAPWPQLHQHRGPNPKSRPRSNELLVIKVAWEEMCSTSLSRGTTSM